MKPLVVLLHGLARGRGSMERLGARLRAQDFETWSHTYPSRKHALTYLASALTELIVERAGGRPLYAVTHSMGGVIVRHLHDPRLRWERIVMLAPP
ncbi:MAG TPA: alpha/beta fold hydrolase, partial [Kofleriaceae bacterium]|nr:alpha/beta fold hydrolase [Kofleriaceae bacterium]